MAEQADWTDASELQRRLGIGRSTFYRWVQRGEVEAVQLGGRTLYRAAILTGAPSQSVPRDMGLNGTQRDDMGLSGTGGTVTDEPSTALVPATQVLALVERYEARIDALLGQVERAHAAASGGAVEVERARADARVAVVEREHERALTAAALAAVEVERRARQAVERELVELRAASVPWWRPWERRRRLSAPAQ